MDSVDAIDESDPVFFERQASDNGELDSDNSFIHNLTAVKVLSMPMALIICHIAFWFVIVVCVTEAALFSRIRKSSP